MRSASDVQRGRQKPRIEHVPKAHSSAGQDVIDLAASVGLHLDPWQQHVLRGGLGERSDGKWQSFEVGLIVPRQNGKGAILEALELAWLFLFDEDRLILHSAHEFKTAREGFLRLRGLIEGSDDLRPQVKQFYASTGGECGIELLNGKRLRFVARSSGAGRGFSPDKLVLDEAYNLPEAAIDAVLPSVGARINPQIWYTSSPGDWTIAPCEVLARVRARGIAGTEDALSFFEWSAPNDGDGTLKGNPEDRRLWAMANPSLGIRKTVERVANFQASMSAAGFAREELGVGNWPPVEGDLEPIFGEGAWEECEVETDGGEPVSVGLAVSIDRKFSAFGLVDSLDEGLLLTSGRRDAGTAWVVDEAVRLTKARGCELVVDGKGPAANLVPELEDAGVTVRVTSTADYMSACSDLFDDVQVGTALHRADDEVLNHAVRVATIRPVGDRWAWGRKGEDISCLEAVTLAAWLARKGIDYDVTSSVY